MDMNCKICGTTYYNEASFEQHLKSKSHLKKVSSKNSIFLHRFLKFSNLTDLLKFFSQYGDIKSYETVGHDKDNIIIEFKNCEAVQTLLNKDIYIKGLRLNISQLKYNNYKEYSTKQIKYNNIKEAFIFEKTFDEQLANFIHNICLTNAEIQNFYETTCKEINAVFQLYFPKCKIFRFGSTVTGLGFKGCDLDITLNIGIPVLEEKNSSGPHIILMDHLFSKTETILRSDKKKFSKCILIRQSKIPIIKFIHQSKKIPCDLSFRNNFGLHNSHVIKFYLSINSRFHPMMVVIKYWSYICEEKSRTGINNYTLTILFIFYLQQIKLAPPFIFLQEKCSVPVTVQGWQINFNKVLTDFQIDDNNAKKNIPNLLLEFFEFYADYDFANNVICPIDGKSHDKELFIGLKNLPKSMQRYKEHIEYSIDPKLLTISRFMCVQDPIELDNNITENIRQSAVEKFQLFCSLTAILVKNSSNDNCRNLLRSIFNMHDYSNADSSKS